MERFISPWTYGESQVQDENNREGGYDERELSRFPDPVLTLPSLIRFHRGKLLHYHSHRLLKEYPRNMAANNEQSCTRPYLHFRQVHRFSQMGFSRQRGSRSISTRCQRYF
jgi:hypothetical protein